MVKCLNIGKNIGKPIYWSISNINTSFECISTKLKNILGADIKKYKHAGKCILITVVP